ncbi:phosphoglycerate dehydrogenase [Brevibacterium aurantiacum]|uniref:D-3-phosphoglycerate dehydrogenase n=1 Tax=Brevibacterium aurantiacum TaxID=273384 RepID=A0A2H1KGU5_BREAU|nr:phosphoglycerate dehydrogenase [Brevibacterium aurantiacum]MDN5587637.1 phosphoglycerate dehydrogenase [Brevibacterium sp.]SMX99017.1 D-3-phosphoglycerate dehydrogenase [Brevibacterium aurantiacum]
MSRRIVITTDYLEPGDSVDRLLRENGLDPVYSPAAGRRTEDVQRNLLKGAVGAIVASEPITRDMLAEAADLRILARSGVGYDSVDTTAAQEFGIRVANTPGVNHHAVAELTLALMLNCAKHFSDVIAGTNAGQWPRTAGTELRGKTLGVIGYGPSGKAIAAIGAALGMKVIVGTSHPDTEAGPSIEFADVDTVVAAADYLTLHARAAGTPMIDADRLAAMKDTAFLINTARGSLIDEAALVDALERGQIAGAALDVLETEPMSKDNPLRNFDNVWITSHLAGQTVEARERVGIAAARTVIDVLDGKEPVGLIV